jgi:hypothetical protein
MQIKRWFTILVLSVLCLFMVPLRTEETSATIFFSKVYPRLSGLEYSCAKTTSSILFEKDKKTISFFDAEINSNYTGLIQPESIIYKEKKRSLVFESVWIRNQADGPQQKIKVEMAWDEKNELSYLAVYQKAGTGWGTWSKKMKCSDGDIRLVQAVNTK